MTSSLDKECIGARCEKRERCYLYAAKPRNPFNCISPMDSHDECPYYAPRPEGWGDGKDLEE